MHLGASFNAQTSEEESRGDGPVGRSLTADGADERGLKNWFLSIRVHPRNLRSTLPSRAEVIPAAPPWGLARRPRPCIFVHLRAFSCIATLRRSKMSRKRVISSGAPRLRLRLARNAARRVGHGGTFCNIVHPASSGRASGGARSAPHLPPSRARFGTKSRTTVGQISKNPRKSMRKFLKSGRISVSPFARRGTKIRTT
jgi:hypothetical protein